MTLNKWNRIEQNGTDLWYSLYLVRPTCCLPRIGASWSARMLYVDKTEIVILHRAHGQWHGNGRLRCSCHCKLMSLFLAREIFNETFNWDSIHLRKGIALTSNKFCLDCLKPSPQRWNLKCHLDWRITEGTACSILGTILSFANDSPSDSISIL